MRGKLTQREANGGGERIKYTVSYLYYCVPWYVLPLTLDASLKTLTLHNGLKLGEKHTHTHTGPHTQEVCECLIIKTVMGSF